MPLRNERTAPQFDVTNPRELSRYFEDLAQLFARATYKSGTDDKEMKNYAIRYVDYNTEQLWKAIPEFKNQTNTYDQFEDAVMAFYPEATDENLYSIRDMDLLVGERQRLGINTLRELAEYHLQFQTITTWLIEKDLLSKLEQQRAYIRALQPTLFSAVMGRL